jgi:hypothetical protein
MEAAISSKIPGTITSANGVSDLGYFTCYPDFPSSWFYLILSAEFWNFFFNFFPNRFFFHFTIHLSFQIVVPFGPILYFDLVACVVSLEERQKDLMDCDIGYSVTYRIM